MGCMSSTTVFAKTESKEHLYWNKAKTCYGFEYSQSHKCFLQLKMWVKNTRVKNTFTMRAFGTKIKYKENLIY